MLMNEKDEDIRDEILTTAVAQWMSDGNPFADFVFKDGLINDVIEQLSEEVTRNDVEYVWKLLTEDGYFRQRGNSRRITAKEIDEAEELGVDTPLEKEIQEAILRELATAEREDVSHPELTRDEVIERLSEYDEEAIDFNLFYCRSNGWTDVSVYISEEPWNRAEITRFGRDLVSP